MHRKLVTAVLGTALVAGLGAIPSAQADVAGFYKGKQVIFYIGYSPGGGYDTYSRLVARHIGRHIPGKPSVVAKNKPGAGSMRLANELYNSLPKDGTAIGMIGNSLHLSELLGDRNVRFTSTKFNWIGRVTDADPVMVVRPGAGVKTFADARKKELAAGVPGAGSSTTLMLTVLNNVLGTKFRLISGYKGSSGIRLAVERGELDAAQSVLWSVHKDWVRRNDLIVLYQVPADKLPGLQDVPSLIELAKGEDERKLINFFTSYTAMGRSVVAPPDVPRDRVAALRAAFTGAMQDSRLVGEAKKQNLRFNPMSGEKLQALVESAFDLSDALKARAREVADIRIEKRGK